MVTALELLENRGDRQPTIMNTLFNPLASALAGCGLAMFINFAYRRPVWSGIQKHIAFTAIGGGLGLYLDKKRNEHLADRDAVLRHYIMLHPEDFPMPERKKYADVLEVWQPIR
ncbi:NADH dehydrogenase [ubiquinone] 1 subunit C2 [Eupeodes corollae]|uniref:NADH dehydrogenase [ubiquinone] 1 subunit C2 n=1 Tax=Eupeodes corollae TaxID=290404 RepID=UPI00249150FB|nr:NADH dehydrogenase [ubiquinone] 1 subunit C2 [Eupeodes corollae]